MNQTEAKLRSILDFAVCKSIIDKGIAKGETYFILCPHYSINIASKYEDGEELQFDLDELSDYLGAYVEVSDYDDLVLNLYSNDEDTLGDE